MNNTVKKIKAFCIKNYENGYDEFVECYSDMELQQYILENNITSIKSFKESAEPRISYRAEIQSTRF